MAEDTYEYECMRAELLGVEKPTMDDYLSKQRQKEAEEVVQDETDVENLKEAEKGSEDLRNVSGGLHELNNILSATQRKLNRFKASCGSLTNLLKIKMGSAGSSDSIVLNSGSKSAQDAPGVDSTSLEGSGGPNFSHDHETEQKKSDLSKALDKHVDNLDLLIEKAESCEISMSQQNKQMRKFLK